MRRDLRLWLAYLALLAGTALACGGGQNGNNGSQLTVVACATNAADGGEATGCLPAVAPADGVSTITLTLKGIAADGSSPYNGVIDITSTTQVLFGDGSHENDVLTMVGGNATETVACAAGTNCVGQVVLTASQVSNGANSSVSKSVTFTGVSAPTGSGSTTGTSGTGTTTGGTGTGTAGTGATGTTTGAAAVPGQIVFRGLANPYLGVDYGPTGVSQYTENTFTFQVNDVTGNIAIPNVQVMFQAIGVGALPAGSYLEDLDPDAGMNVVMEKTDATGRVSMKVHSGQASGTITITATVVGTGIQTNGQAFVVGTQPSVANSSLSCSPANLAVYVGDQGSYPCEITSAVLQKTVCTANLADRFKNVVTVQVAVKFFSEAGNFEQPSTETPAFGSSGTGVVFGAAQNTLDTNGSLPEDVSPLEGEPNYTDECSSVPGHVYNPRDGLVTVIAVFQGEESFTQDATKVYQPGNSFLDLPQPFVDSNDNSIWDPGEFCAGQSDSKNRCLGPNGVWDSNANVFLVTQVLYTGNPKDTTVACNNCAVSPFQGSTISFLPPSSNSPIPESGGAVFGVVNYADINLNTPAAVGTTNVLVTGDNSVQVKYPVNVTACPNPLPGGLGMSVIPLERCTDGGVPDDAGNSVESVICSPLTSITNFSGGTGDTNCQYELTNSNTQDAGVKGFTVTATLALPNDNGGSQSYDFFAL